MTQFLKIFERDSQFQLPLHTALPFAFTSVSLHRNRGIARQVRFAGECDA